MSRDRTRDRLNSCSGAREERAAWDKYATASLSDPDIQIQEAANHADVMLAERRKRWGSSEARPAPATKPAEPGPPPGSAGDS